MGEMAKRIYLTAAAALTLLAACNGPSAPHPALPPQPEPQTQAELPPPPLLGGPPEAPAGETLLGGPYATDDRPGPLTTFRRADGVEVTVMRPIPNPGDDAPISPRHRAHADQAPVSPAASPSQAPPPAQHAEALAPSQPVPPPKVVEHPRRAAPPHGVRHKTHIKPPVSPQAVVPPPATPSLVDRLSDDRVQTPGGETSPKALLGLLLVLVAMVLLVAIARRLARAREARERARRAAARQASTPETEPPATPATETPPEPEPRL
jgi:HAMP domain-containing protein